MFKRLTYVTGLHPGITHIVREDGLVDIVPRAQGTMEVVVQIPDKPLNLHRYEAMTTLEMAARALASADMETAYAGNALKLVDDYCGVSFD